MVFVMELADDFGGVAALNGDRQMPLNMAVFTMVQCAMSPKASRSPGRSGRSNE